MSTGAAIVSAYYASIKKRFLDEDASSPSRTLNIESFSINEQRYIRLWAEKGILVEMDPGYFYLNISRAMDQEKRANKLGFIYFLITFAVVLVVLAIIYAVMPSSKP
jgi:hypothetical protein